VIGERTPLSASFSFVALFVKRSLKNHSLGESRSGFSSHGANIRIFHESAIVSPNFFSFKCSCSIVIPLTNRLLFFLAQLLPSHLRGGAGVG
jgi:hypothetical protein